MLKRRKRRVLRIFLFHLSWSLSQTFKPAPAKMSELRTARQHCTDNIYYYYYYYYELPY